MTIQGAGALEWPIRTSFVAYVEALPDGRVEVEGGASRTADGGFVFPAIQGEELAFAGSVRFHGHAGVLDVTIADPRVEAHGESADVTVALVSGRIRFATVGALARIDAGVVSATEVAATDDGAYVLGGIYQPGAPLDSFTVHIAAA